MIIIARFELEPLGNHKRQDDPFTITGTTKQKLYTTTKNPKK